MMDAYAPRLYCTFVARVTRIRLPEGTFLSTAFIYDNALLVLAYLARRTQQDTERAKVIGNALLYAQQHDPMQDGRFSTGLFRGKSRDSNGVLL